MVSLSLRCWSEPAAILLKLKTQRPAHFFCLLMFDTYSSQFGLHQGIMFFFFFCAGHVLAGLLADNNNWAIASTRCNVDHTAAAAAALARGTKLYS